VFEHVTIRVSELGASEAFYDTLDPDGNSAEAVYNGEGSGLGAIDHLWIRVSDLVAALALCEELGRAARFEPGLTHDDPPRVGFRGRGGFFSLVRDGAPTRNARIEFGDGVGLELDAGGNAAALRD
jgi:hypothetical protein